jgi:hypothetical protein
VPSYNYTVYTRGRGAFRNRRLGCDSKFQARGAADFLREDGVETGVEDSWGRTIYENGFDQAVEGKWKNQYLDDDEEDDED